MHASVESGRRGGGSKSWRSGVECVVWVEVSAKCLAGDAGGEKGGAAVAASAA